MAGATQRVPDGIYQAAQVLWDYHRLGHELHPASVGIALGSHDLGVATHAAELFHRGLFPLVVVTGATSPTTASEFPRGEAIHYRDHVASLGVPAEAILVEEQAANTGENILFARRLLAEEGVPVTSAILISRPYQERRAYATCRKLWPEIDVRCSSQPVALGEYLEKLGAHRVLNMLAGDTQRIIEYPQYGYAIEQPVPEGVVEAYRELCDAGFTERLINE